MTLSKRLSRWGRVFGGVSTVTSIPASLEHEVDLASGCAGGRAYPREVVAEVGCTRVGRAIGVRGPYALLDGPG